MSLSTAVVLSIVVCLVFMLLPKDMSGGTVYSFDYPEKLFGTDMIEIDIQADEATWRREPEWRQGTKGDRPDGNKGKTEWDKRAAFNRF